MKPQPPDLPPNVEIYCTTHDALTNQVDAESQRGQCWAVRLDGEYIGEVHLGKTKYRLQSIHGKPHRLAWMVNDEARAPEYNDRNAAVMGLLEIARGRDPSRWHTPAVPRGHLNAGHVPINDNVDDCNDVDDSHPSDDSNRTSIINLTGNSTNFNIESVTEDDHENDNDVSSEAPATAGIYSPTQIKKYEECPRKWGWEYLAGFKPPQGAAAAFGERVHTILERWLSKGMPPDPSTKEGKVALASMSLIPKPSPHLEIERPISFTFNGHKYRGFVDLGYWTQLEIDGRLIYVWVVHDHKTTGDFMWALTEEDLLHDVQAIIYAYEAIERHSLDVVLLSWGYLCTRGKAKGEPRRTLMTRADIESGMVVIHETADKLAEHRRVHLPLAKEKPEVVLQLEANAYACGNFGGCPFQDRCNLTKQEKRRSIMAKDQKKMSMKEKMAARKASRHGDTPDSTPNAVAAPKGSTPAVNPPEQPSHEEQVSPLSTQESAANEDKKGKGGKGSGDTSDDKAATVSRRGRPAGSKNKDKEGVRLDEGGAIYTNEEAFVTIYAAAVAAGEQRHMDAAEIAWSRFKKEFGE